MVFFGHSRGQLQKELFDLLSNVTAQDDFQQKCESIDRDVIISARDSRYGYEGYTILHYACHVGNFSAVTYLLQIGHDLDPVDCSASLVTPLMVAISLNRLDISCAIVEAGGNLFKQDIRMENAMHYAARVSSIMVKQILSSSKLEKDKIQALVSTPNIKNCFPEDVAKTELIQEVLENYRNFGVHIRKKKEYHASKKVEITAVVPEYNFIFATDSDDNADSKFSI